MQTGRDGETQMLSVYSEMRKERQNITRRKFTKTHNVLFFISLETLEHPGSVVVITFLLRFKRKESKLEM